MLQNVMKTSLVCWVDIYIYMDVCESRRKLTPTTEALLTDPRSSLNSDQNPKSDVLDGIHHSNRVKGDYCFSILYNNVKLL